MNTFKEDLITIYKTDRSTIALMILSFLISVGLFIFSIININPNSTVVKTSYSDIIGGYHDGTWTDMIAFPILIAIFGILHNFIALRIFHKRGSGMTKFFLVTTIALLIGTLIVMVRLLGEV